MALTYATEPKVDTFVAGNKRFVVGTITFDSSYPTGGELLDGPSIGLHRIDVLVPFPHASRIAEWDDTNLKLKLHTALGTEAANASDQATITVRFLAIGV